MSNAISYYTFSPYLTPRFRIFSGIPVYLKPPTGHKSTGVAYAVWTLVLKTITFELGNWILRLRVGSIKDLVCN